MRRPSNRLVTVLLASVVALGTFTLGTQVGHTHVEVKRVNHYIQAPKPLSSYNWSGYSVSGQTYDQVSAYMVVPKITCQGREDEIVSEWIGLDGFNDDSVEQLGVSAQCWEGQAYYYTWYEMFPANPVQESNFVQPGDVIYMDLWTSMDAGAFHFVLDDLTTPGNSFSTVQSCSIWNCQLQSAEFVVERPAYVIGQYPNEMYEFTPLAPFGIIQFANCMVDGSPLYDYPFQAMYMIDDSASYYLAEPSILHNDDFAVRWENSF